MLQKGNLILRIILINIVHKKYSPKNYTSTIKPKKGKRKRKKRVLNYFFSFLTQDSLNKSKKQR